mmetsp:Transcript_34712/g.81038  ORF Transcript_34712/g.81038 Transcript_34712/m.81038 type:complete len:227 (-) Transcript_34712:174-854(-)
MDWAITCRGNYGILLPVRAHEIEICVAVIVFPGVINIHGCQHEERRTDVVPPQCHPLHLVEGFRSGWRSWSIKPKDLASCWLSFALSYNNGYMSFGACVTLGSYFECHDAWCIDPGGCVVVLLQSTRHDDHAILNHSTTMGLGAGPLHGWPRHVSVVFQDEGALQLTRGDIPNSNVVAFLLDVSFVGDEVCALRRKVKASHRPSDQRCDLAYNAVLVRCIQDGHAS